MWKVLYRIGFTPWENIGEEATAQIDRLLAREGHSTPPHGRALDIGCGRGAHSLRLARLGWQVTGIDVVPLAVKRARRRAAEAGVIAWFVVGDVTRMSSVVGDGYRFLVDVGCFHTLSAEQQEAYVREATAVAEPGAALLLFAFAPGMRRPLPPGVSQERIEAVFGGWKLADVEDARLPPRLAAANARWYRLRRAG
jgi:cyclopropane fatty-acyl-phospholipid synthase-like methyltransferase